MNGPQNDLVFSPKTGDNPPTGRICRLQEGESISIEEPWIISSIEFYEQGPHD